MRAGWLMVGAVLLAGCDGGPGKPPPEPLPTDGPNQVVFYVPART